MHEMAITQSVLNIVLDAARQAGAEKVTAIRIKMGEYSDVVPVVLKEYFAVAARGTAAEGAVLELERLPVTMRCRACRWQGVVDKRRICCGECGGTDLTLLTGREFYVESIEAE